MTEGIRSYPCASSASITSAWLAIAAIVFYQILLIVLIFLRPELDPSWHSISEWAIGRYGWMMSVGFVISGVSYAALGMMLKSQVKGVTGRIGMSILFICVIGALGVGVCTTDPMPLRAPLSTRGTLHVIFGTSQLVLFPFAALLINLDIALKNKAWAQRRQLLLWTAGLPLCGFGVFVLYSAIYVVPLGPQAYGPGVNIGWPPRFAFFTYMLWVVTLAWQGIRCSRSARTGATLNGQAGDDPKTSFLAV